MCSRSVRAATVRSGFSKGAKQFAQNSPRKFGDRRKVPHASLFYLVFGGNWTSSADSSSFTLGHGLFTLEVLCGM